MIEVARQRCASMREATVFVLANLDAWSREGEVSIDYIADADGVAVLVERVSDVALALRRGSARAARAA